MRESFTYGSVGRAPRKRCLYPEPNRKNHAVLRKVQCRFESSEAGRLAQNVIPIDKNHKGNNVNVT